MLRIITHIHIPFGKITMPLFGRKNKKDILSAEQCSYPSQVPSYVNDSSSQMANANANEKGKNGVPPHSSPQSDISSSPSTPPKPKLSFQCQQAHGSPVGIISGFTNVKELYMKIAECYDIEPSDVSCSLLLFLSSTILFFTT